MTTARTGEPQKIWLPLTMVVGLVLAVVGGTVWLNDNLYQLKSSLALATKEIQYTKEQISKDTKEIKEQIKLLGSKAVTASSFRDWVKLLQAKNPNLTIPLPGD